MWSGHTAEIQELVFAAAREEPLEVMREGGRGVRGERRGGRGRGGLRARALVEQHVGGAAQHLGQRDLVHQRVGGVPPAAGLEPVAAPVRREVPAAGAAHVHHARTQSTTNYFY